MKDDVLFEAFRNWEELSLTDEKRMVYESRLKKIRDEEAAVIEAELRVQEAREEAQKKIAQAQEEAEAKSKKAKLEGKAEGEVETARRFLARGFDLEMITDITGLTKEEIIDFKKES